MTLSSDVSAQTTADMNTKLTKRAEVLLRDSRHRISQLRETFSPEETKKQTWKFFKKQLEEFASATAYATILTDTEKKLVKMIADSQPIKSIPWPQRDKHNLS